MQSVKHLVLALALGLTGVLVLNCTSSSSGYRQPQTDAGTSGSGGTAGVHGGSGASGRAGAAGNPAAGANNDGGSDAMAPGSLGSVGAACNTDAQCVAGLSCLTANSSAWLFGGPTNGYCTADCAADATICDPFQGTVCVGASLTEAFCFEACTRGGPLSLLDPKCQGREDVACYQDDPLSIPVCQPSCGSDSQCPQGRFCDMNNGVCVDAAPQGDPIGTACDPNAATDPCQGFCDDFGDGFGLCTGLCTVGLGYSACGVDPAVLVAPGTPLCLPVLGASDGVNDTGLCIQRCNSSGDCLAAGMDCDPFNDAGAEAAFQALGFCWPAAADGGAADASTGMAADASDGG